MKEFDLKKALAGEPVVLRNGSKAFIVKHIPEDHIKKEECELIGYLVEGSKFHSCVTWTKDGKYNPCFSSHIYDIIGMYEEPRPTATINFTCPLKEIEEGQEFWHIVQDSDPLGVAWAKIDVSMCVFNKDNIYHSSLLEAGLAFKSEEDAKDWLDAMKNARR
ncbi:pyruvate kinase [Pasteurella multocida]